MPIMVSVFTRVGGRISSHASALASRLWPIIARRRRAPQPRYIVNIEPLILTARSPSMIPSSVPMSQCGTRWWSAKVSGPGPCVRSTTLSSSLVPSGASGDGRFGMRRSV